MAHDRKRQVDELFSKLIHFSPIIGVFGHRQVGKTTYTSSVAGSYYTLDDRDTRSLIASNPKLFLNSKHKKPVVIDECQVEPDLFPALKEHVRTNKHPGQYILTGSVRFTSRKAIRESLAGRMTSIDLFPLVLSEIMNEPLPDGLPQLIQSRTFTDSSIELLKPPKKLGQTQKFLEKYLSNGGLPGLCFLREDRLRKEGLSALHHLILDRDLRMVVQTRLSQETLIQWLKMIAENGWEVYHAAEIKRALGLSFQTQKNLLFALESIFFIRRIPIRGRSGEIILLEDQFEERTLSSNKLKRSDQILSAFYRNVRVQFQYRLGDSTNFESYWTRSGARIPLVIRNETGALGFSVISESKPTLSQSRAAESFLRHEPSGKIIFIADKPIRPQITDPRILICAAAAVI